MHCGPEEEPDDDPPELLELLELVDPPEELLDPLEPLDPDEELEPLDEPLELAAKPPNELDPLLELRLPPLLPLLLLPPLLGCPESECPPSDALASAPKPPSTLGPPSSPGLPVSAEAHAEAMPALSPTRQTTRRIRRMLAVEVARSGFEDGGWRMVLDMVLAWTIGKALRERRPPPPAKAHVLAREAIRTRLNQS